MCIRDSRSVAHLYLGRALLRLGTPQAALPHLDRAAALDPSDAAVHYQLWQAHNKLGQQAKADAELIRFRQLSQIKRDREQERSAKWQRMPVPATLEDSELEGK